MSSAELLGSIRDIIRGVVNNQNLEVKAESQLVADLGLESIDLLDLSSELENTIGQELDFKEVAEYISQKTGKPADMKSMRVQDMIEFIGTLK